MSLIVLISNFIKIRKISKVVKGFFNCRIKNLYLVLHEAIIIHIFLICRKGLIE
jgi:hypothetical protein